MKTGQWVETLNLDSLFTWDIFTCVDFLALGDNAKVKLPGVDGQYSASQVSAFVHARLMNILSQPGRELPYAYRRPQKRGVYVKVRNERVAIAFDNAMMNVYNFANVPPTLQLPPAHFVDAKSINKGVEKIINFNQAISRERN